MRYASWRLSKCIRIIKKAYPQTETCKLLVNIVYKSHAEVGEMNIIHKADFIRLDIFWYIIAINTCFKAADIKI